MRNSGVAGDPRVESLCFRRLRAMVASLAETLGGDEASRFRTIPLSLGGVCVSGRFVERRGCARVLFRVGVGDEGVDHEVAVKNMYVSQGSIACAIVVGDGHVHMLESWLEGLWMVDVGGGHCSAGSVVGVRWSDHGHLFIYRPR